MLTHRRIRTVGRHSMGARKKPKSGKIAKRTVSGKSVTSKRISEGIHYLNHDAFRSPRTKKY